MLTRDQFLAAPAPTSEVVAVPLLGGEVRVKMLSAGERDAWEIATALAKSKDWTARLVVFVAVDDAGAQIFTPADVAALSAKDPEALAPIADAAIRLNRLSAADVRELEKNSEAGPNAGCS